MGHSARKRKMIARVNERRFPFVVQIAVPEGGFGLTLDAINAWHRYTKNLQRRTRPQHRGQQRFGRWCFESLEVAEKFKARFGGEIVPSMISGRRERDPGCATGVENKLCGSNERLPNNG
jgi:hypothetical protein